MYKYCDVYPMPVGLKHEDVWWRCEFNNHSDKPFLLPLRLVKTTPKGVWVKRFLGEPIRILGKARKQYAAPTKELALHDALCRKQVQARIFQRKFVNAVSKAEQLQALCDQYKSGEQRI